MIRSLKCTKSAHFKYISHQNGTPPRINCGGCSIRRFDVMTISNFQADVRQWVQQKLENIHSAVKDSVLPEVKMLVHLLQDCNPTITPIYSIAQYLNKIGVDYYRVASLTMESKVCVLTFSSVSLICL